MKRIFRWVLLAIFASFIQEASAQQTAEKFVQELNYLLYLPKNYAADTSTRWPMILFLHGSGESGTDLEKVKAHGPPRLVGEGKELPFIIVSPQATRGWQTDQLNQLVIDIKKKYRVDEQRVYLTGLSMGGFGTWELAMEHPEHFAAIAPICGGAGIEKIYQLRHMPVWAFHGAKDNVVPPSASIKMMEALKPWNTDARLTMYPEANHDSWTLTYNNDSLYSWFLSKKKFTYQRVKVPGDFLLQYSGKYVTPESDTLLAFVRSDSLFIKTERGDNLDLQPLGNGHFFFNANSPEELIFEPAKGGKGAGFLFLGRDKLFFPRLVEEKTKTKSPTKKSNK